MEERYKYRRMELQAFQRLCVSGHPPSSRGSGPNQAPREAALSLHVAMKAGVGCTLSLLVPPWLSHHPGLASIAIRLTQEALPRVRHTHQALFRAHHTLYSQKLRSVWNPFPLRVPDAPGGPLCSRTPSPECYVNTAGSRKPRKKSGLSGFEPHSARIIT